MPTLIASVVSTGKATLHELSTVYGIRDCYDMLEIAIVDHRNQSAFRVEAAKKKL